MYSFSLDILIVIYRVDFLSGLGGTPLLLANDKTAIHVSFNQINCQVQ